VRLVTPLYFPLLALSAVSVDGLTLVPWSPPQPLVVPRGTPASEESMPEAREASCADGVSLGIVSVEVDGPAPSLVMTLGVCFGIG
jgi:hypothetical protein